MYTLKWADQKARLPIKGKSTSGYKVYEVPSSGDSRAVRSGAAGATILPGPDYPLGTIGTEPWRTRKSWPTEN